MALAAPEGAPTDGFDRRLRSRARGRPFTLEFDNEDPGVQHNVVIFGGPDAEDAALFAGTLVTGPGQTTYAVEPLAEG